MSKNADGVAQYSTDSSVKTAVDGNKSVLKPVILAGGTGSRLWPLSRKHYAKQYLALDGGETLLQATMSRLEQLDTQPAIVICNDETRFLAAEQMRQIGAGDALILLEPVGRNTAPAIALAALEASLNGQDPILLVMPSDHDIGDRQSFSQALAKATQLADLGHLVTFGIKPTHPETGFGYIQCGDLLNQGGAYSVDAFVEKPDETTARSYLTQGNYFWNSGIFIMKASRYLEELEKFRPDVAKACRAAFSKKQSDLHFLRVGREEFENCPDVSIDYAVMENTRDCVVVPLDAGWSDVGSWAALWRILEKDDKENCNLGDVINLDGERNYIHAESRLVATIGLKDMVVVETKDAVLVATKSSAQDVKKLFAELERLGRREIQYHREVFRPWGKFDGVDAGEGFQVKRITVNPGAKLSLQKHKHRSEHWVVVRGTAIVTRGEETFRLNENQSTYIPVGTVHALENPGDIPLELIEVQTGDYLGEDDIVRFEDKYGRN